MPARQIHLTFKCHFYLYFVMNLFVSQCCVAVVSPLRVKKYDIYRIIALKMLMMVPSFYFKDAKFTMDLGSLVYGSLRYRSLKDVIYMYFDEVSVAPANLTRGVISG